MVDYFFFDVVFPTLKIWGIYPHIGAVMWTAMHWTAMHFTACMSELVSNAWDVCFSVQQKSQPLKAWSIFKQQKWQIWSNYIIQEHM